MRSPYAVLVSEMMLQQTQVATVTAYFERWMMRFPDFAALAGAPEADVLHAWQGLGYYSRARNLHRAAKLVVGLHDGKMPCDLDAIRALPGLGRYTAGAVMAFAFDRPAPVVDANIARVLARLFDVHTPVDSAAGQKSLWKISGELQPEKGVRIFNEALMELGALVCLPRTPKCTVCPVQKFCRAKDPGLLPVKKPRARTIPLAEDCAWIFKNGHILLEQQSGRRWHGLWNLPQIKNPKSKIQKPPPLLQFDYPFTNHRVTLSVFPRAAPKRPGLNQRWFSVDKPEELAMPSPHRRALETLLAGL